MRPEVEAMRAPSESRARISARGFAGAASPAVPVPVEPSVSSVSSSTPTPVAGPWVRGGTRSVRASNPPTSFQPMETGTVATPPAAATGSAMAWSMAIFSRAGQRSARTSSRSGASQTAAMASMPWASWGLSSARWSRRTPARTTNMPAFQR